MPTTTGSNFPSASPTQQRRRFELESLTTCCNGKASGIGFHSHYGFKSEEVPPVHSIGA
jgi:hypothetical protein